MLWSEYLLNQNSRAVISVYNEGNNIPEGDVDKI